MDPRVERTVYDNALEQVKLADELGFDQVWAVEHHFLEEYSHCPAPELFLTACATLTKRIRVGFGIVVCVPEFSGGITTAWRRRVRRDGTTILELALIDPEIVSGGDLQYIHGVTLARLNGSAQLIQVDPHYTVHRAARGRAETPVVRGTRKVR